MPSKLPLPLFAFFLIGALLATAAHASTLMPAMTPLAFEEEFEGEGEGEFEEEPGEEYGEGECEIAEEELEEGFLTPAEVAELCAAEEEGAVGSSTAGCPLRSAKVHASRKKNRLKLTIGYTTRAPTKVRVEVRAGKRKLGSYKRRLGRSGALRVTKRLGKKRVKKIRVRIMAPMCKGFEPRPAVVH